MHKREQVVLPAGVLPIVRDVLHFVTTHNDGTGDRPRRHAHTVFLRLFRLLEPVLKHRHRVVVLIDGGRQIKEVQILRIVV